MKKVVGYVISIAGLVVMAIGFGLFKVESEVVSSVGGTTGTVVGIVAIIVGVVISLTDKDIKRGKQAKEEVPIYKNKKIVGYRRE